MKFTLKQLKSLVLEELSKLDEGDFIDARHRFGNRKPPAPDPQERMRFAMNTINYNDDLDGDPCNACGSWCPESCWISGVCENCGASLHDVGPGLSEAAADPSDDDCPECGLNVSTGCICYNDMHEGMKDNLTDLYNDRLQPFGDDEETHSSRTMVPPLSKTMLPPVDDELDPLEDVYDDDLKREAIDVAYNPFNDREGIPNSGSAFCLNCYGELDHEGECPECFPESEREVERERSTMVDDLRESIDDEPTFPDTAQGAKDALKFLSTLDPSKIDAARVRPAPYNEGTWYIYGCGEDNDYERDAIVYLKGFEGRTMNDFEQGSLKE